MANSKRRLKTSPDAEGKSPSWRILRNEKPREVIAETSDEKKVDALNTAKYEAVPIQDYLEGRNSKPDPSRSRRNDNQSHTPSGVSAGLPAIVIARSIKLGLALRRFPRDGGEAPSFRAFKPDSLSDALRSALASFEPFTGSCVNNY